MASSFINPDAPDQIYKWIERKSLTEAVLWTPREKFYIIACVLNYGCDWNIVVRILKKVGEPYRPKEWYTPTSCERQFKIILNSQTNEVKSMEPRAMLKHMYDVAIEEFKRDLQRSHDNYVAKYSTLNGVMKRMMQGNLSRNEVNSLYSQVRRTEIEGKQYMEQLRTRQNAYLASENSSSGSSEEPIKWNSPSAPLLTSLLRSRNTIPANRNTTAITSQFQSPIGTSRTRSGKLLPLSPPVVKTSQGTPTLSKLLEAPANPYIPSPSHSAQKIKQSEIIGTDRLNGNNSKKENSQSPSLNRVRVDSIISGPFNQLNKSDLSYSKKNTSKSQVSAVKNGSKASSSVVNLLSDSENEEDKSPSQNIHSKNIFIFGEKKEIISSPHRIEPRATRSQTRADGGFKQLNDNGQSDEKNESDVLPQQIEGSQMKKGNSIDDIIDIDQIEIEPLSTVQDEITISSKVTRSSTQRLAAKTPADNLPTSKTKCKEINNQMLEEISTNFVLNSPAKNVAADFKNLMVGQSRIENTNITGCFIPVDSSALKDAMILQKDGQCFPSSNNTLTTFDGKVLRQKKLIELKSANIRCFDGKNDKKILTLTNQPIVVVNKIKKPFNIKLAPEVKNKTDITNFDPLKATIRYQSGSQNLVQLLDGHCSFSDEVIIIDDDVNINVNDGQKESSKSESQIMSLNTLVDNNSSSILSGSKTTSVQLDKKTNDKTLWNLFGKPQNLIDISSKKLVNQDVLSKTESNLQETNNRFIKELDFDFEQSTSISDFYNGVEEIVEMHSFDNEDLNSLIESGSLGKSEPEKHPNTLDQGDSFVSEGDSTIGAFDTFAQITRVAQKPISKDTKSVNREPKTVKQIKNVLEHKGFVHVEENEDHSSTTSVTGIPVLQGVISDVMSKINSDRVAALNKLEDSKSVPLNDIVEISSDEEETVCNEVTILNVEQSKTQECDKVNLKQLNEDKSQTINKLVPGLKDDNKSETNKVISKNIANNISNEINKSDKINSRNITFNASKKCVTNKLDNVENIQRKIEIDLNEDSPKINKSKSSEQNIEYIEKRKEIDELKNETEPKLQFDSNNLKQIELMVNTKKTEVSLFSEIAERNKQEENQREVINMEVKETKTKEFEAEIMLRSKQNEERKAKVFEMIKLKESEIKVTKEVEIKNNKDAVIEKPRKSKINEDNQFQKGREFEVTNITEDRKQKDRTVEMQRKTEEANLQNANEAENQNVDESCTQIAREAELLKSNNLASIRRESESKDTELRSFKEAEIPKSNEGSIRKPADEIKEDISKECESKKLKTLAGKKVAEAELNEKSIKIKEIEFVKLIDNAELRKNVAQIKKDTEVELKSKSEETEGKLLKEQKVLTLEEQVKITKKSEQSMVDTKIVKDSSKEIESKMVKSKVQEQQKVTENEKNQNIDAQIITRTRGSKVEDKLRESNLVSQNIPLKQSVVLIKPYVPPKSDVLFTNLFLKNENKCNPSTHEFPCGSNSNSGESFNEVGSKSRTRSSTSFKQSKVEETKSLSLHKSNDQNESCTVPKASLGTKTKISTTLDQESPTSSSNLLHKLSSSDIDSSLKSLPDNNGKKLRVSVEMLSADAVPSLREIDDQHSNNTSIKLSKVKSADNEHLSQNIVDINEKLEKPGPKKRGRKRRIDVQNEDFSKSTSDKLSPQNGATAVIITPSTSEIEPPAKRTRKSIESLDNNIMSLEKTKKKILKMFYDSNCEGNQLLLTFEKQIKNTCPEYHAIIKDRSTPLELRDIKENIDSGEILDIPDLQVKLFLMCINTIMLNVNKSSSAVIADDATNFILHELPRHFPSLLSTVNEDDEPDQNKKNVKKNDDDSGDINVQLDYKELEFSDTKSDDCNSVQSEDDCDKVNNYVSTLSDCCSDIDSNYESLLLNHKEKETDSDSSSNYDDDSDHYNSKFF